MSIADWWRVDEAKQWLGVALINRIVLSAIAALLCTKINGWMCRNGQPLEQLGEFRAVIVGEKNVVTDQGESGVPCPH